MIEKIESVEPEKPRVVVDKPAEQKPVWVESYVPKHNVKLPDFAAIRNVSDKKRRFFGFLGKHVVLENERLLAIRIELLELRNKLADELELSVTEQARLNKLAALYKVDSKSYSLEGIVQELAKRIDGLPKELVLMQAANESAWGTSRFARLGLNFFGQWCYTPGCGIVPRGRPEGKTYEVEAFMSVQESVVRYFRNINTNPAYQVLRDIRAQLRANHLPLDAQVLATGLVNYSQRGDMYVQEISKMIEHNRAYMAD